MTPEQWKEKLVADLNSLGLRPAEREVIVDFLGWNNRDKSLPRSAWSLLNLRGFVGLLLKDAIKAILGDAPVDEVCDVLNKVSNPATIVTILGWEKQPAFAHLKHELKDLLYLAPEVRHVHGLKAIEALLNYRMDAIEADHAKRNAL